MVHINSEADRVSRVNKTKSPIVEKNYKTRANRSSEPTVSKVENQKEKEEAKETKITKAIGMGRRRAQVEDVAPAKEEVRDESEQPGTILPVESTDEKNMLDRVRVFKENMLDHVRVFCCA